MILYVIRIEQDKLNYYGKVINIKSKLLEVNIYSHKHYQNPLK
jgi:hypothetical protein